MSVNSFFDLLGGKSVYICGMTKSLCAGLRIAYMAFGEELRERILHCRDNTKAVLRLRRCQKEIFFAFHSALLAACAAWSRACRL